MGFTDFVKDLFGIDTLEALEKQTNAVDMLKADHRKVEILFKEFEKDENSQKQDLLDMIIKELTIHATIEEELVYPLIEPEDKDALDEALEEHHHVKIALAELSQLSANSEEAKSKVKVLSELVKHHVKEEESELLPKLKHTKTDMEELGSKIKARKGELNGQLSDPQEVKAQAKEDEAPQEMNAEMLAASKEEKAQGGKTQKRGKTADKRMTEDGYLVPIGSAPGSGQKDKAKVAESKAKGKSESKSMGMKRSQKSTAVKKESSKTESKPKSQPKTKTAAKSSRTSVTKSAAKSKVASKSSSAKAKTGMKTKNASTTKSTRKSKPATSQSKTGSKSKASAGKAKATSPGKSKAKSGVRLAKKSTAKSKAPAKTKTASKSKSSTRSKAKPAGKSKSTRKTMAKMPSKTSRKAS